MGCVRRSIPSPPPPSPRLPGVPPAGSAATSCGRTKLRHAQRGRRRLSALRAAPAVLRQAALGPSRACCRQDPRAALGILRRRLRVRWDRAGVSLTRPVKRGMGRSRGPCALVALLGPLVAALKVCSDSPGTMKSVKKTIRLCQVCRSSCISIDIERRTAAIRASMPRLTI